MPRFGPEPYQPCGTPAAARRHYRHGEPPCHDCAAASRADRSDKPGISEDWRPVRNGIPWKPYRYNGAGYDINGEPPCTTS